MTSVNQDQTAIEKEHLLGAQLRQARLKKAISLRELARRVGLSASFLSQVERDLASPSVGTLYSIVSALDLSLDSLMHTGEKSGKPDVDAAEWVSAQIPDIPIIGETEASEEVTHLPNSGTSLGLQRANERPEIFLGGVRWERLTPQNDPEMEFLRVTYAPGSESCPPDNLHTHRGKEYFHILSGRLDVQVAFTRQTLAPGDSINFDSSIPHRLSNPYEEDCIAIWFVVGRQ